MTTAVVGSTVPGLTLGLFFHAIGWLSPFFLAMALAASSLGLAALLLSVGLIPLNALAYRARSDDRSTGPAPIHETEGVEQ